MTISVIKEKLHSFVENGDPKKIKAIYTMLENEIQEDIWTEEFTKEMDKRVHEMENNLVKTYSWDEVKQHIRTKKRKLKK